MIKYPDPKAAYDLSHVIIPGHSPSLREVRAGTQGNNLETEKMEELCFFTCLLNHAQLVFFYSSVPVAWGWFCL